MEETFTRKYKNFDLWNVPPLLPKEIVNPIIEFNDHFYARKRCEIKLQSQGNQSGFQYENQYGSAFVRRVPVIQTSPKNEFKHSQSYTELIKREELDTERLFISYDFKNDRRSISSVYDVSEINLENMRSNSDFFKNKNNNNFVNNDKKEFSNQKLYKKEKLKIIFNEKDRRIDDTLKPAKTTYFHNQTPSPIYPSPMTKYPPPPSLPWNLPAYFSNDVKELRYKPYKVPLTEINHSSPYPSRGNVRKRERTIYTPSQLKKLEEKFKECSFIVGEDRQTLSQELNLREQQVEDVLRVSSDTKSSCKIKKVKIWFQNRRTKCKQAAKQKLTSVDV